MAPSINEQGEIPGGGPQWACREFGADSHDYLTCSKCQNNFTIYLAAKDDLGNLGLLPAE